MIPIIYIKFELIDWTNLCFEYYIHTVMTFEEISIVSDAFWSEPVAVGFFS